jgi:hypothetical protein
MRKRTTLVVAAIAVVFIGTLLVGAIMFASLFAPPFEERPFSQDIWLANHNNPDPLNPRVEMADDLMKHHLRKGMSRRDVLRLLGRPDRLDEQRRVSYHIGMQGFVTDPGQLEVEFDTKGTVVGFRVVER